MKAARAHGTGVGKSMRHKVIVFDVSSHGLGHLAQTGPVVGQLKQVFPSLRIILRSGHAREVLSTFINTDFEILPAPREVTMVASSAMIVDLEASAQAYQLVHNNWPRFVAKEVEILREIEPDAVIANVGYLSLAAAQSASVPNLALCCMHWLDVYRSYFSHRPEASAIIADMAAAYSACDLFVQVRPHMPMNDLSNRRPIGVIARCGRNRASELRHRLGLSSQQKIVLFTLGGLPNPPDTSLPTMDGVHWIAVGTATQSRKDVSDMGSINFPFIDLVASVDVVFGKDSYGTVAEAACAGTRLVMVPRANWPETSCLVDWAAANCTFALASGGLNDLDATASAIRKVLDAPPAPIVEPTGMAEAVQLIAEHCAL